MAADINHLIRQLDAIRERADALVGRFAAELDRVHPDFADSARNLLHYVALRQVDLREAQDLLTKLGLSSLGRAEQNVLPTIEAVQKALRSIGGEARETPSPDPSVDPEGNDLQRHKHDLLGAREDGRSVSIMVTLPTDAAHDEKIVAGLIDAGMDVARINCAHDSTAEWQQMAANVRQASETAGRPCRIAMDLAGPKFHTGALEPGPRVLRLRPRRDSLGNVTAPRHVRCVAESLAQVERRGSDLPVPQACIDAAEVGDEFRLRDARGRKRALPIVERDADSLTVEVWKTAYLTTGTTLRLRKHKHGRKQVFPVGMLPCVEQPIELRVGDGLVLEKGNRPGRPAEVGGDGQVVRPARVSCHPRQIIEQASVGDPVSLNDGKIRGVVDSIDDDELIVRITYAKPTGSRLRSNRGINLPKSKVRFSGMTRTDRANLPFVAQNADIVSMSFVRSPSDVIALQEALDELGHGDIGIVPKIETETAFRELPRILLATMRRYPAGIMIARGDLAIECGWARLAEIQEEILWLCEAARIPVIWATQVLEGSAKKGLPTRAEITDAARSHRADCVMLNKGPNITGAIRMLDEILRSMDRHQRKKSARLSKLGVSEI